MPPTHRIIAAGLLAMSLAGCHATEPGPILERRVGVIALERATSITVPAEGLVGMPVPLTIVTIGGGCVPQGDTEVTVAGLAADVTPYDSIYVYMPLHMACPDYLQYYKHETSVSFATAGPATVRFHGWAPPGSSPVLVERTIQIR